jgi:hypothetical protein
MNGPNMPDDGLFVLILIPTHTASGHVSDHVDEHHSGCGHYRQTEQGTKAAEEPSTSHLQEPLVIPCMPVVFTCPTSLKTTPAPFTHDLLSRRPAKNIVKRDVAFFDPFLKTCFGMHVVLTQHSRNHVLNMP